MSKKQNHQIQTSIRFPDTLLARIKELAERMSQPGMRVTSSEALRLATFRGVELLEADHPKKKKQ